MSLALVTGGGGFLGKEICKQLVEEGWQVRSLGRSPRPDLEKLGVRIFLGSVTDKEIVKRACDSVDVVFHVAAMAGIWGSWSDFYSTNVLGSRNILESCQILGVKKLIYTSSPSVIFDGKSHSQVDESIAYPKKWLAHYPKSKAMAEQELLAANDPKGLRTLALRPHLIWGVGDPHLIPRLIAKAKSGRLMRVGSGENQVDMVHVSNAARAHLDAYHSMDKNPALGGQAYFITNGEPVYLWKWIDELLCELGIAPVKKRIHPSLAYGLGGLLEGIYRVLGLSGEPPMTRFLARQLFCEHTYNIQAAKKDLAYEPRVSMEEGLKKLLEELKSR